MGDMIVKQGDPATARRVYLNAKLATTYQTWPFKGILEDRMAQADENVARFRRVLDDRIAQVVGKEPVVVRTPTMMISSRFACSGCHQQ
jgi:hypothetical protein